MPLDLEPGSTPLSAAIGEMIDDINVEVRSLRDDGKADAAEFLVELHSRLTKALDAEQARQAYAARSRESDLRLIEQQGGFADRTRMPMLVDLLLAEYGEVLLSGEGITRIADAMLAPAEGRRRRLGWR